MDERRMELAAQQLFQLLGGRHLVQHQIDAWHLAGLAESGPRGLDVEGFAQRLAGTAAAGGQRHASVTAALAAVLASANAGDRILVFGSFHTVAGVLGTLQAPG